MISVSTLTYDLLGSRVFENESPDYISAAQRRGSKIKTLDGGVSIKDGGYCAGDRTITVLQSSPATEDRDFCDYIIKNYSWVAVSCSDGVFKCRPDNYSFDNSGNLKFVLWIKESLS